MTQPELYQFITTHKLAVLGSISTENSPQSALVGIAVTQQLEIVFDTLNTTRKYKNLLANPKSCFVIGWEDERTIQFEGQAFLPEGDELTRYKEIYFSAWPDGRNHQHWTGLVYFVIRPTWIRYSDYTQQPAHIEEHIFPA